MKEIRLINDAWYNCGNCRIPTEEGKPSIYELNAWYEADGEDAEGNYYNIIYKIINPDAEAEEDTYDWDDPFAVIDSNGCLVPESDYKIL